jgi:membrane-bound inhibitor of C-type lysozyme
MSLSIEQIAAVSYPAVLAEMRKAANQWVENAALREMERQGVIQRISLGATIEAPLDYRQNPDAAVLASDQDEASLVKTEVVTSASYAVAQLSVPVVWTKGDDAKNPTENQKIALVKQLLENGINTHDDLIEQCIFTTSTAGGDELNGLSDLVTTAGTGVVGGIDSSVETWWKNYGDTYTDASDIEATFTVAYNKAAKGSGSTLAPKFMISGATPHAMYEAGLQSLQRFVDTEEADGGYKILAFKTARYVFSQYGGTKVYFLNPKNYNIVVSKQYFRDKGNTVEIPAQNAFVFKIYSALQAVVNNRSRLAVVDQA